MDSGDKILLAVFVPVILLLVGSAIEAHFFGETTDLDKFCRGQNVDLDYVPNEANFQALNEGVRVTCTYSSTGQKREFVLTRSRGGS